MLSKQTRKLAQLLICAYLDIVFNPPTVIFKLFSDSITAHLLCSFEFGIFLQQHDELLKDQRLRSATEAGCESSSVFLLRYTSTLTKL